MCCCIFFCKFEISEPKNETLKPSLVTSTANDSHDFLIGSYGFISEINDLTDLNLDSSCIAICERNFSVKDKSLLVCDRDLCAPACLQSSREAASALKYVIHSPEHTSVK